MLAYINKILSGTYFNTLQKWQWCYKHKIIFKIVFLNGSPFPQTINQKTGWCGSVSNISTSTWYCYIKVADYSHTINDTDHDHIVRRYMLSVVSF